MVNWSAGLFRFSPGWGLTYMTVVNLIIYMDRSVVGTIVHYLKEGKHMGLSDTEAGVLGSVFILGYMLSSPMFALFSQHVHPLYLMGIGLLVWCGATFMAALSVDYPMLIIARAMTGVGEASFVCLAPPYIFDVAPVAKKTLWVAIFYAAMIVGAAIGFVYGQEVSEGLNSWRWPFAIECFIMLPLLSLCFLAYKDPIFIPKKMNAETGEMDDVETKLTLLQQMKILARRRTFVLLSLGYGGYAFTVGGLSFWGPDYQESYYGIGATTASLVLGALTVLCGFSATFIGSVYMDYRLRPHQRQASQGELTPAKLMDKRTEEALRILVFSLLFAAIVGLIGAFIKLYPLWIITVAIAEFCIFMGMGPVGVGIMSSVSTELRGQANGMSIFVMHLLGDLWSPFIIGFLSDVLTMYVAYIILIAWLLFGSYAWFLGWRCAKYPNRSLVHIATFGCCGKVISEFHVDTSATTENEVKLV